MKIKTEEFISILEKHFEVVESLSKEKEKLKNDMRQIIDNPEHESTKLIIQTYKSRYRAWPILTMFDPKGEKKRQEVTEIKDGSIKVPDFSDVDKVKTENIEIRQLEKEHLLSLQLLSSDQEDISKRIWEKLKLLYDKEKQNNEIR